MTVMMSAMPLWNMAWTRCDFQVRLVVQMRLATHVIKRLRGAGLAGRPYGMPGTHGSSQQSIHIPSPMCYLSSDHIRFLALITPFRRAERGPSGG
ncbi:hypothetical protein GIB67_018490 [Kingdonia uniflora]|uniref:Uncharacterized protein n=1 Tax=Kingdonia uniflora TaxID=39325 RepID=A0A7J7LW64_9MAGN|nr:hypothetical protein GIB67_018490 [Kingdonia uniflora]